MVLHRDEAVPVVLFGGVEGLGKLPGRHAAGAEVAHLARAHEGIEGFQGLLDWRRVVPAMDLVEVDVLHLQPAQGIVTGLEDVFTTEAAAVRPGPHRAVDLGRHDDIVARGHLAQPPAGNLLADAVRVDVGRIEEVDPGFEGDGEMLTRLVSADRPGAPFPIAVAHASQADARHGDSRIAKLRVLHGFSTPAPNRRGRCLQAEKIHLEEIPRPSLRTACGPSSA